MVSATVTGMAIGFFMQIYCNAARRLPLRRHPWEHLLFMGLGAGFCNWSVRLEETMSVELEKDIAAMEKANSRMPKYKRPQPVD